MTLGYDGEAVVSDMTFHVERGQKVGIVGPNGAGKSTLVKALLGTLAPMKGTVEVGSNVKVATFAQHQVDQLDFNRTAMQEVQGVLGPGDKRNARTVLGSFGFPGEMAERRVGDLSGGERTRLALCKALIHPVNLLVLDEPTNHLDLASCDLLEDALRAYPGTVLLVSHDRYLIREICDCLVAVRAGAATYYPVVDEKIISPRSSPGGNSLPSSARPPSPSSASAPTKSAPVAKRDEAERRNSRYNATKDLRKKVERLERDLGTAEALVSDLQRQMADPGLYDDADNVQAVTKQYNVAKDKAAKLTDDWLSAVDQLERTEKRFT